MKKTWWATGIAAAGTFAGLFIGWSIAGDVGLGRASSVMTAIGLAMSVYVAIAVTEIRGRYVRQGMLKDCHERLQSCNRNLKTAITRNDPEAATKQLTLARTIIERVREHASEKDDREWPADDLASLLQLNKSEIVAQCRNAETSISNWILYLELDLAELELDHRDA